MASNALTTSMSPKFALFRDMGVHQCGVPSAPPPLQAATPPPSLWGSASPCSEQASFLSGLKAARKGTNEAKGELPFFALVLQGSECLLLLLPLPARARDWSGTLPRVHPAEPLPPQPLWWSLGCGGGVSKAFRWHRESGRDVPPAEALLERGSSSLWLGSAGRADGCYLGPIRLKRF